MLLFLSKYLRTVWPINKASREGYWLISGPGKERPRRTMIRWSWRRRILTVTRGSWTKDFPTY